MILVAGSANLDFSTRVPHLPAPGETVLGASFQTAPGGKGANQAVACARAGGKVSFFGALGDDPYAEPLRAALRESGVRDLTIRLPVPTGAAFISVSEAGENAITVASGANALLQPEQLPDLAPYRFLVLQLELPLETVQAYAAQGRAAGLQVVLNAAPARTLSPGLLAQVDVLVVNRGELEALAGAGEVREQLARVRALGPSTVLVTLGAAGSLARWEGGWAEQPGRPAQVVDTTGAGDTYVGSLVAALSEGRDLPQAMAFATCASALACEGPGAQAAMPWRAQIEEALVERPPTA